MLLKALTALVLAVVAVAACTAGSPTPVNGPVPASTPSATAVQPTPTPTPVPTPSQPTETRQVHRDGTLTDAEWFAVKLACLLWNDALGFRLFEPTEFHLSLPWSRIVAVTAQKMGGTAYAFGHKFTDEKPGVIIINRSRTMPEDRLGPVALHELGHVMGLAHSEVKADIMYAYTDKQVLLTANDIARARARFRL